MPENFDSKAEIIATASSDNKEDEAENKINEILISKGYGFSVKAIRTGAFESNTKTDDPRTENGKTVNRSTIYTYYVDSKKSATFLMKKQLMSVSTTINANIATSYTHTIEVSKVNEVEEDSIEPYSSALRNAVAEWYRRLLVFAIVGMMSVLVYIGIRILLTSVAQEKAKYKQLLGDWFVGMILLFTMHYIMVFSNMFVDRLTNALNNINSPVYIATPEDKNGKINKALNKENGVGFNIVPADSDKQLEAGDVVEHEIDGNKYYTLYTTLMGRLRYDLQDKEDLNYGGYTILFLIMVIYLIVYSVMYLKRVIYMAFLTMIAPLVALTYPIDKANDGKAQGFDTWFKEYIFNLLIQPLHLMLYTLLISSALKLAEENLLYAIVAMGFMTPAEKLLRTMFNFQKANTPGLFGGVAGGALLMSGMRWLMGHGPKGGAGGKGGSGAGIKKDENGSIFSVAGEHQIDIPKGSEGGTGISESVETGAIGDNILSKNNPIGGESTEYLRSRAEELSINGFGAKDKRELERINNELAQREQVESLNIGGSNSSQQASNTNKKSFVIRGWNGLKNTKGFKGLKNAAGAYKDGMLNKFSRSLNNAQPVRFMGRMGARIAGGAALGMFGIAAGAATGDASKTAQYAGMATAGGAKLGKQSYDALSRVLGVEGTSDQFQRGYLGEKEYQKTMAKKNQALAMRNEEYIRKIQEKLKLDREAAKKRINEMIPFYYDNKITDINEMLKMEKAVDKDQLLPSNKEEARARALLGHHLEEQYSISSKMEKSKRDAVLKRMQDDYKWNEKQAKQFIKYADAYNRANKNL